MPKILFITSKESDYLQDLTYRGLVQVLGSENVIEVPWNPAFYKQGRGYPRNLGYSEANSRLGGLWRSITADLASIDLVVVGSAKPDCFEKYIALQPRIPAKTPVAFLDGGDRSAFGGDLERLKRPELWDRAVSGRPFQWIFKREYLASEAHEPHVVPFPFSFDFDRYDFSLGGEKRYQASFWAVESDPVRTKALQMLEGEFDCRENGTHRNQVFRKYKRKGLFYLQELARCKIVLNFRGVGWDTLRYWEVPGVGSMQLSQRPQISIPENFTHGKEIVFCQDDLSDLTGLIAYYLKNEPKLSEIARAGHAKARRHHSTRARAEFLLRTALR